MIAEKESQVVPATNEEPVSTLGDRMQSAGIGVAMSADGDEDLPEFEEETIDLPGELLAGSGLRLSNRPDDMPALIAGLRRWRGMTQAQLGEAIGYPAPVIGNIEQGSRKLGLKTLGDIFTALGGDLYIEFREKQPA